MTSVLTYFASGLSGIAKIFALPFKFGEGAKKIPISIFVVNVLAGVLSALDEAWATRSPLPLIKGVGLKLLTIDYEMTRLMRMLMDEGASSAIDKTWIYVQLYSSFMLFLTILGLSVLFARALFTAGNPWLTTAVPLGLIFLFLVEYYVEGHVLPHDQVVEPLSGVWMFIKNYRISMSPAASGFDFVKGIVR